MSSLGHLLQYQFRDPKLRESALTHKSALATRRGPASSAEGQTGQSGPTPARSSGGQHNERLEFLGDAVLGLALAQALLERHPQASEGLISKTRASLVNETMLAQKARALGLGQVIYLGKGEEQTGGREKNSILSGSLEALMGALFLDGGWDVARQWIYELFEGDLCVDAALQDEKDPKTALQERVQKQFRSTPRYELQETQGPDHAPVFRVSVIIEGKVLGYGEGSSKRLAERAAALAVLQEFFGVTGPL